MTNVPIITFQSEFFPDMGAAAVDAGSPEGYVPSLMSGWDNRRAEPFAAGEWRGAQPLGGAPVWRTEGGVRMGGEGEAGAAAGMQKRRLQPGRGRGHVLTAHRPLTLSLPTSAQLSLWGSECHRASCYAVTVGTSVGLHFPLMRSH